MTRNELIFILIASTPSLVFWGYITLLILEH